MRADEVQSTRGLLGGHVGWRPQGLPLDREVSFASGPLFEADRVPMRLVLSLAYVLGEPPVQNDHLTEVAQQDVLPLEVAVQHSARVGVGDGVADGDKGAQ